MQKRSFLLFYLLNNIFQEYKGGVLMGVKNKYGYDVTDPVFRKERLETVEETVDLMTEAHDKGLLPENQLGDLLEFMEELKTLRRVDRCADDVLLFTYEYFSDERNPENENNLIPRGVDIHNAPNFHRELCELLNNVSNVEVDKRVAFGAPRGHGKSAYLSNVFPVHQVAYGLRRYILILSETDSLSKKLVEWVGDQLKYNQKLRDDFGEILSPSKGKNDRDNQEAFLTHTGVLVETSSTGKQLRGKRNGAHRPDLVILDDLESSKNTNTAELRQKNLDWFNKVVIPIGEPKKTAFLYMGTIVHVDGLLVHALGRSDFETRKYSAIIEPPDRQDLWDEFEEILRNQENPDRLEDARAFYQDNKVEMDKGVEVLWAGRWDYRSLIEEKVNMGTRAFNSEYLNNPIDPDSQIFIPDNFLYFDYGELHELKPYMDFYGAWDIALGKNNRSDYNAVIIVGRDRRTGVIYVVDAWAKKVPAHKALEVALEKIKKWQPKAFSVETVASQFDLYRQLKDLMMKKRVYTTKLLPLNSRTKKEERIESMEPLFENGAIRFMRHQRLLIEQLEQFPNGTNDDLPDTLQMAVNLATKMKRRTIRKKPKGL